MDHLQLQNSLRRGSNTHHLSLSPKKAMRWLRTPKDIWNNLKKDFNFTIDICASKENHLVDRYYTKKSDALTKDWSGEIAYIHPLFNAGIYRFVKKAYYTKNFTGVLLLPAATHTNYFHNYIYHNPNCEIRFLKMPNTGFRFGHDNGSDYQKDRGYMKPLMIVIFRNE